MTEQLKWGYSALYEVQTKKERERRQAKPDSQSESDRQADSPRVASQIDSQSESDRQAISDSPPLNILAGLPDIRGFLKVPNRILDALLKLLNPEEQIAYIQLYRLSWGNGKESCYISYPKLSERTNIKQTTLKKAIKGLVNKGLIIKSQMVFGSDKEQGIVYKVPNPDSQSNPDSLSQSDRQAKSAYIKEKGFKRKDINSSAPKITRLTPEDKQETIAMIVDLITKGGYSFEQAQDQFGGNLSAEDWTAIRVSVEGQQSD